MPDFDEPVNDYETFLKDQHARVVTEYFEKLVKESGIDEQENIETVAELREAQAAAGKNSSSLKGQKFLRVLLILSSISLVVAAIYLSNWYYFLLVPAVALLVLLFAKLNKSISSLSEKAQELEAISDEISSKAWAQMEPLNNLYNWGIARKLFEKSYPDVKFDSYFADSRLKDLQKNYDLSTDFGDDRSCLNNQSGELKGNPFVFTRFVEHVMGAKTYTGSIVIFWTEQIRDANGNWISVQRSQTLPASVTKPFPEYSSRTMLLYGNESGPKLSFTRRPSSLSGKSDGALGQWRVEHEVKKAEKMARKAVKSGAGNFTVMSNHEFEALFAAKDRDNEVEFRLLFTPHAQQEMVKILKGADSGYGDNFLFVKSGTFNLLEPEHLSNTNIDANPAIFYSLELAEARQNFLTYQNEYFKSLYFAFAPLLSIPLYREKRSLMNSENSSANLNSCSWEHEAIANVIGHESFAHPESITHNILKTTASKTSGDIGKVSVTAQGFKGIPRVDIIPVLGLDRNWHNVPVHWTEYMPVKKTSEMIVGLTMKNIEDEPESKETYSYWSKIAQKNAVTDEDIFTMGPLLGAVLKK